jgi:LmbE family N-acetylglucosaminyl deacetylase
MTANEMGPEPSGLILIAAHADDAAFSLGGAILKHALPLPISAVTIFSRTDYAPYQATTSELSVDEITRISKEEDMTYFARFGINVIHLDFLDAPLRGYTLPGGPYAKQRVGKSLFSIEEAVDDPIYKSVADKLGQLLSAFQGSHVAIPLGLGCHIDHLITSEACSSLRPDLTRIYYEDVPYAEAYPLSRIERIARMMDKAAWPRIVDITGIIQDKIKDLGVYRSQVSKTETDKAAAYARRLGGRSGPAERFWVSESNTRIPSNPRGLTTPVSRRLGPLDTAYRRISKRLNMW